MGKFELNTKGEEMNDKFLERTSFAPSIMGTLKRVSLGAAWGESLRAFSEKLRRHLEPVALDPATLERLR